MGEVYLFKGEVPNKSYRFNEPSLVGSIVPVIGSGRYALYHLERGNHVRAVLYTALAITDVFLIKSIAMGVGRLAVRGGAKLFAGKEMESMIAKFSADGLKHAPTTTAATAENLVVKASASEFKALGARFGPGAEIAANVDGWFIKRVNPTAGWFRQQWGAMSIEAQYQGLSKLGNMAPEFFIHSGMLFTRSVGVTGASALQGTFWSAFFKGSYRMGTLANDIRPRNMSMLGKIFDPALDPIMKMPYLSLAPLLGRSYLILNEESLLAPSYSPPEQTTNYLP